MRILAIGDIVGLAALEYLKARLWALRKEYKIDVIAIGNGTASRESESFIVDVIKSTNRNVEYIIVKQSDILAIVE